MKATHISAFIALFFLLLSCEELITGQEPEKESSTSNYDSLLAKKLGTDDYGMRQYVMAFLKSGPNRSQDSTEAQQLQRAHMDNITRLAQEGKLIFAGPFMDDSDVRGIYIFSIESLEDDEKLTSTDAAIQAGRLVMELHPFYGSAALMQINEIHQMISKEKI